MESRDYLRVEVGFFIKKKTEVKYTSEVLSRYVMHFNTTNCRGGKKDLN